MVGSFSSKVNRYVEVDVRLMNCFNYNERKEKGANTSGEPTMGQVLC